MRGVHRWLVACTLDCLFGLAAMRELNHLIWSPAKGIAGLFQLLLQLHLWYHEVMETPAFKRTPKARLDDALETICALARQSSVSQRDAMELMTIGFLVKSATDELFDPAEAAEQAREGDACAMAPTPHKIPEHFSKQLTAVAVKLHELSGDLHLDPRARGDLAVCADMVDWENNRLSNALKAAKQSAGGTQKKISKLGQEIRDLEAHLALLEREARA